MCHTLRSIFNCHRNSMPRRRRWPPRRAATILSGGASNATQQATQVAPRPACSGDRELADDRVVEAEHARRPDDENPGPGTPASATIARSARTWTSKGTSASHRARAMLTKKDRPMPPTIGRATAEAARTTWRNTCGSTFRPRAVVARGHSIGRAAVRARPSRYVGRRSRRRPRGGPTPVTRSPPVGGGPR